MLYTNNTRTIHTGLFTKGASDALKGVLGQLSDGWGEDNPRNDSWWEAADIRRAANGEIVIIVSEDYYICGNSGPKNNFVNMSDDQVKTKFAYWIKKTAMMEHVDMNAGEQWKPDSQFQHRYFKGDMTTAQAFAVCAHLTGRDSLIRKATVDVVGQPSKPNVEAKLNAAKAQYDVDLDFIRAWADEEKAKIEQKATRLRNEAFTNWTNRTAEIHAAYGAA